jgi:hypothetical protein
MSPRLKHKTSGVADEVKADELDMRRLTKFVKVLEKEEVDLSNFEIKFFLHSR